MRISEIVSDQDKEMLNQQGWKQVESATFGDYSVHLFKMPYPLQINGEELRYSIGLQKDNLSFTSAAAQHQKVDNTTQSLGRVQVMRDLCGRVTKWIDTYGPIVVASHVARNSKIYSRMFTSLGLTVTPIDYPGASAFYISK